MGLRLALSEPDLGAAVRTLMDEREITAVLYQYSRAVDRLDLGLLARCFWPDGTFDYGVAAGSLDEFAAYVERARQRLARSHHAVCNVLINVDGDAATVESYLIATHDLASGDERLIVWNRYLDRFEHRNGEWRIADRTVIVDLSEQHPVVPTSASAGADGPNDPLYRLGIAHFGGAPG